MTERKRMDIKEFREEGYLQEVNRRFFHPLGLALEIEQVDETGKERLKGIWDVREDPEGIYFVIANSDEERKETFRRKQENISFQFKDKERLEKLGFVIEPIPERKENNYGNM